MQKCPWHDELMSDMDFSRVSKCQCFLSPPIHTPQSTHRKTQFYSQTIASKAFYIISLNSNNILDRCIELCLTFFF